MRQRGTMNGRTNAAFTLIELLVVIMILGLLASILIPAVSAGLASAHSADCKNVLRQTGVAITSFRDDNDGYYPPGKGKNGLAAHQRSWADGDPTELRTHIAPYLGTAQLTNTLDKVFRCKAAVKNLINPRVGAMYVVNHSAQISDTERVSVWGVKNASAPLCYAKSDVPVRGEDYMISDIDQLIAGSGWPGLALLPKITAHRGHRNAIFFDNHIEQRALTDPI